MTKGSQEKLSRRNIELSRKSPELQKAIEREATYTVMNPDLVAHYKATALPIEQVYISSPNDEFSLRVRAQLDHDYRIHYMAAVKDRGVMRNGALERIKVETPISEKAYKFYAENLRYARLRALRAEPIPGASIDFVEGFEVPVLELKGASQQLLLDALDPNRQLILEDQTENPWCRSEAMAYHLSGKEIPPSPETADALVERITRELVARYASGSTHVIAGISGMSGSGKSTVAREVQRRIGELYGDAFAPVVISTDDYHRGKNWLEKTYGAPWTNWDDPRVYNTRELAADLALYQQGVPLTRRHFDFATEERVYDEVLPIRPFVIVEGLFASSEDLADVRDLHVTMPAGTATAIGRDVRRLVIEGRANAAFPTPQDRLRYQIETALPTYLAQERPVDGGVFAASSRVLGERAFMLEQLQGAR